MFISKQNLFTNSGKCAQCILRFQLFSLTSQKIVCAQALFWTSEWILNCCRRENKKKIAHLPDHAPRVRRLYYARRNVGQVAVSASGVRCLVVVHIVLCRFKTCLLGQFVNHNNTRRDRVCGLLTRKNNNNRGGGGFSKYDKLEPRSILSRRARE